MPRLPSKPRTLAGCALAVTLLVLRATPLPGAQATTITLQGMISAGDGNVPSGAQVDVQSRETGVSRRVLTDAEGAYSVLGLAPGVYDVSVRAIGYRQQRVEAVRLVVGQRATLDFALQPGAVELPPTVITAERAFEVRRTDISTPVLREEIEKLPLNSRNLLNLAVVAPGIRTSAPSPARSVPAAGSLPAVRFINLYVDGIEWKGPYIGNLAGQPGLGTLVPQEAVREFRVYLNPYDAEYTRGANWVISAVTHRGGNALEGSVFAFHQNEALISKAETQTKKPDFRRYQTGFNLRGPLARDRAFFSVSYEAQLTDNYIDVAPGRPAEAPDIWDTYRGAFRAPLRLHAGLLRITIPRGPHTFDAIWAGRYVSNESAFGVLRDLVMTAREAGTRLTSSVTSIQLMDTYAMSSIVNELSLNYFENTNDEFPLAAGPTLKYPGIQIGTNTFPLLITSRHLRVMNKTSFSLAGSTGRHVLKAGLEANRLRTITYRPTNKDGFFEFASDTSTLPFRGRIGVSVSDDGSNVTIDTTATRGARVVTEGWVLGAHVQDQWQPLPSLTITAGLRYDAEIDMLNQHLIAPWATDTALERALGEEFLNTGDRGNDLDNLAPRVAVAWDMSGTGLTVLRGGYGVMYDRVPIFGAQDEHITVGWRTFVIPNPGTTDPGELRCQVATGGFTATPNLVLLKDRLETPTNRQWSLGFGHQLGDHVALNLDYIHQRVSHVYVTVNANWRDAVTGQRAITTRYGDILVWDDFGDAKFDAVLASVTYDRPPTRATVAYTLAWSQSEFGALTTSDFPDRASYSMQRSPADERHRVVVSGFTTLPFRLGLSALVILASPQPFLVITGTDDNHNGTRTDDWPNGIRTLRRNGWEHWYRTVDLRLAKSLALRRGSLAVTAEVFNLLNWANHFQYEPAQNVPDYGEPVSDHPRRQAQLGVRYQF